MKHTDRWLFIIVLLCTVLAVETSCCRDFCAKDGVYRFADIRLVYRLDLTDSGTLVTNRETGDYINVPYGDVMEFARVDRYSKDTSLIIHNVRSHAESYHHWDEIAVMPVDYLRTGAWTKWDGQTVVESINDIENCPHRFPDQPDKVVVAYVNLMEFGNIGEWDFAFDPSWDADNDALIDSGTQNLPEYVDPLVFNEAWKNYVAVYWSESWKEVLKKRIDLAAVENFDGILFDVMTGYWEWLQTYPSLDLSDLRQKSATLIREMSEYAKSTYGTAFLITANLDSNVYLYFPDLREYVDGGYFQNAFFRWEGSAVVDGYGLSESGTEFVNASLDFIKAQGLSLLDLDHLGTGPASPDLDFVNYDDRITEENLLLIFRWAAESGSLPYVTPVFMSEHTYDLVPRFSRIRPGLPSFANTEFKDWALGSDGDDLIETGAGDDLIYGGTGNDRLYGGPGSDGALYLGIRANYEVSQSPGQVVVTDLSGHEGVDTLYGIERLVFEDSVEDL